MKDKITKSQGASGKVINNLINEMLEERKHADFTHYKFKLNNRKHIEGRIIQQID